MDVIKQEQLKLDDYTKQLINSGIYKLYNLTNSKDRAYYAIEKADDCFILLDQDGYPLRTDSHLDLIEKKQLTFEKIKPKKEYSFNAIF